MPQANQLLPISTQTTASTGSAVSQPIENNTDLEKGDHFSSVLDSEIAQKDTTKSSLHQNPQPGNSDSTEGQKLPQDGKPVSDSTGFYVINKEEFVAGLDLQLDSQFGQTEADNHALLQILSGTGIASEKPLASTGVTGQNTVIENGIDAEEVLAELGSEQAKADTNTQVLSADDISSRSALPEASVVGQQKAVENILKHSEAIDEGDTEILSLRGNAREVSARLAALMQKQDHSTSVNEKMTGDVSQKTLDADRLLQEMDEGKKLFNTDLNKANTMRFSANALGTQIINESIQNQTQSLNVQNQSGIQPVSISAQPAQLNVASNVTQTSVIDIPLKQQGWDQAMGHRVAWQINQNIQSADIRLNPPHLGPLEVRIKMTDEGANVTFSSQHGVVRDAVEAALPKLREMLEGQGINLANTDVSEQNVAQHNSQGETGEDSGSATQMGNQAIDDESGARSPIISVSNRMLDLFA